jgi:hypothetical protein
MPNMPFFSAIHPPNAPASEHNTIGSPFELPLCLPAVRQRVQILFGWAFIHAPSAPIASSFRGAAICTGAQIATRWQKSRFNLFWRIQPDRVLG